MASSTDSGAPRVLVITGQSGAGKGTLIYGLFARVPQLELGVSATTRGRRPGEEHGREYWFLTDEEFDDALARGDFLEHVTFPWGQRSGTLRSEIERIAARGRVCILELETNGALAVRDRVPGAVTIFVTAPLGELERRLRDRATESSGEIEERLALARRQLAQAEEFDHVVVNDDVDRALAELTAIVERAIVPAGTISGQ